MKTPRLAAMSAASKVGRATYWSMATVVLLLACSATDATTVDADRPTSMEEEENPVYTGPLPPPEERPEYRRLAGEGLEEPPRASTVTPPSASSDALLDQLGAFLGGQRDAGLVPAPQADGDAGVAPVDAGFSPDAG